MCQAKVYLSAGGATELVAEDVILLQEGEGEVTFATFFDEPRTIRGRVSQVDFLKHTVTIIPEEEAYA